MEAKNKINIRGQMYTIEFKVWKENKYGEPDIVECHGEYFSEEAAIKDMNYIDSSLWYVGLARTETKIIKKIDNNERTVGYT